MASIYIHIPFCRKACHYCDFHFSTSLKSKDEMVKAICAEIGLRKNYLGTNEISSLYFGGGTPSLLEIEDIRKIIAAVNLHFRLNPNAEITLEANPDDLIFNKIGEFGESGINRLSIGVQSFQDEVLKLLNRTHGAMQAIHAIKESQKAGFQNLTIDLMYGLPGLTVKTWENNLKQAFELGTPHISAYCLTVEKKTALHHFVANKRISLPGDDITAVQYEILMEMAEQNGFEHYEISNFCKPGMHSRHNSSYWNNEPYLGIGPSAHSYNGDSRQWNIANNAIYMSEIKSGGCWFEKEELLPSDKYNEYLLTRLRTSNGINLAYIRDEFGKARAAGIEMKLAPYITGGLLWHEKENVFLTRKGKLIADKIISDFFN